MKKIAISLNILLHILYFIHNLFIRSNYSLLFIIRLNVLQDGGVQQVEVAVRHQMAFTKGKKLQVHLRLNSSVDIYQKPLR